MKRKILIVVAVIAVIIFIIIKTQDKDVIFMNKYTNYANGHVEFGYYIYSNGIIQEFDNGIIQALDNRKGNSELKQKKINKDELQKLKQLINSVEDKYEIYSEDSSYWNNLVIDGGTTIKCVYKKEKEIVLLNGEGSNSSKESVEIKKLTEELCEKYLNYQ